MSPSGSVDRSRHAPSRFCRASPHASDLPGPGRPAGRRTPPPLHGPGSATTCASAHTRTARDDWRPTGTPSASLPTSAPRGPAIPAREVPRPSHEFRRNNVDVYRTGEETELRTPLAKESRARGPYSRLASPRAVCRSSPATVEPSSAPRDAGWRDSPSAPAPSLPRASYRWHNRWHRQFLWRIVGSRRPLWSRNYANRSCQVLTTDRIFGSASRIGCVQVRETR